MLVATSLSKSYGNHPVSSDLTLYLAPGEVLSSQVAKRMSIKNVEISNSEFKK